ncbi:MAG: DUF4435 domain-containing protein [Methylococcaceae bacterium]|nr:DUF4435 domain-containing protein [Methylococcaceae bacterium]
MRKYLDENSTINTIRLELRHPAGKNYIWVLVEGETDQKLFAKLINGKNTKVEIVHGGVASLRKALAILVLETRQILGIRDADFLHIDHQAETIAQLFLTDAHDSEMMLIACDTAFQAVVAECFLIKLAEYHDLRTRLLASLVFLGGIRWLNHTENLELNFKGINFANFYDAAHLTLDKLKCLQEIEGRSPNKKRAIRLEEVDQKAALTDDYYNLINGHDFEKAFACHVKCHTTASKAIKDTDIGKGLRLAYRIDDFQETKLYAKLKNWEIHTQYLLF